MFEYDFYLPELNILIEFHGRQHFEFVHYFHRTEDNFLAQKERDMIKRQLAKELKYKLIELDHKQLESLSEKQFEELLLKMIK